MISPALELSDVSRSWQPGSPVFSNLNLCVSTRGITVLLGPSGCGKSTLLRCAASLDIPEEGVVKVRGMPVSAPSPDRQLILQEDNQLLPWLTVGENVAFPVKHGGPVRNRKDRTKTSIDPCSLLDSVGLPDSSEFYPSRLSGGMKQRAVLARALAAEPAILLLDEPFAALDTVIRSRLQLLLRAIHEERKTTMLLVTHDIAEALVLADIIVFMDSGGRIVSSENNPLGTRRDMDSMEFHEAIVEMRHRYSASVNPIDL